MCFVTETALPSVDVLSARLLDILRQDGDQWLWEIVWALDREFPDVAVDEKVARAREVVVALTLQGRIELWRGQWPAGPVAPLSPEERAQVLTAVAPWHDPEAAGLHVVIEAAG
jgi:hypothetical protein